MSLEQRKLDITGSSSQQDSHGVSQKSESPKDGPGAKPKALDAASHLLKLEAQLRQVKTHQELTYFVANEFRLFTRAQQVFVVRSSERGVLKVEAVSALTFVDDSAPLILELQKLLTDIGKKYGLSSHHELDVNSVGPQTYLTQNYPLSNLLWVPFLDLSGATLGGMVLARMDPWSESDITIALHLAGAASFAWMAIRPKNWTVPRWLPPSRRARLLAVPLVICAAAFPVSMSALAPIEVAPKGVAIVTAGVDGVVENVDIDPNAAVQAGQPLVRISDTVLRNRYEIAEREVLVAEARQKKAAQLAFLDAKGRHELAIAQSELELKMAERNYAREMLQRTIVKAPATGIAFYSDNRDLIGRPVAVGEKVMEIVDPDSYQFNIDLPVSDAIVLNTGARVKVFLDFDPLNPIEAVLVRADYKARARENNNLAFRLVAEPSDKAQTRPRLGVRGTAEVYSGRVPLIVYLLRKPLAAARQHVGL